ncbi:MAG: hypothetical protein NVS4B3_22680 [Gemmatimonadaceae bacterium]
MRPRDADPPKGTPPREKLESATAALLDRAAKLQRAIYAEGKHALLVVLQARDTGGKDGTVKDVFGALNPAGCVVTSFKEPTPLETRHDFLWRVHHAVPAHGIVGVFNRSHYEDVIAVRVQKLVPKAVWRSRYAAINDFERLLVDNGTTILKLFLHISRDEQRSRLRARLEKPAKNWKFNERDLIARAQWDDYTAAYREALARCTTPAAPWYVVPSNKKKVRNFLVAQLLVATMERLKPRLPRANAALLADLTKIS